MVLLAMIACAAARADDLKPGETEIGIKLKLAGEAEGLRDLGLVDEDGFGIDPDGETAEGYLDGQLTVLSRPSENWRNYLRLQGFVPSGAVVVYDEDTPRSTESYAALREAWLEYGGLTDYPGEVLRLGRQRVRERDGLWWDRDIESVRWLFESTLLQGQLGIAEQFHTFRTGDSELPASQRDRAYLLAGLSSQWRPGHFYGLRATYGFDHFDLDEEIAEYEAAQLTPEPEKESEPAKLAKRRMTWVGVYVHNGYYQMPEKPGLYYWLEAGYVTGTRDDYAAPPAATPEATGTIEDSKVHAFGGELGLRWQTAAPLAFGLAYAYAQGDEAPGKRYEQTGLQSNRSRFTGTRSLVYRFNDALRAEMSNLQVASAFLAYPGREFDASLVYHYMMRDDGAAGVVTDGLDVQPATDERFLGHGYDLVLSRYFGTTPSQALGDSEDLRSNLRLRASMFQPGDAYGDSGLDAPYRVTLEVTLWFGI